MTSLGDAIKPFTGEGEEAVAAGRRRALIDHRLVDEIGIEHDVGDRRTAFNEKARDAAPRELIERFPDGRMSVRVDGDRNDLGAKLLKC